MPKVIQQIKFNKTIRRFGLSSVCVISLLALAFLFPYSKSEQTTEALTGTAQGSSLTLDIASATASVDLTVTSSNGTFATSSTNADFSVATDNYSGYTLSISANNNDGLLYDEYNKNTLSSIETAISADTFSAAANKTYNGKWGYKPNKYNSQANTNYLPAPTLTASTLDKTSTANSTANNYTIEIGARTDYSTPSANYSNTFTITAVSNPINYTINYNQNTSDTVSNMPTEQNSSTSATEIKLSDNVPTRDHYTFTGWCSVAPTASNGVDACTGGTTFLAGANYGIDKTTQNVTTLYAMWKIDTFVQTTQVRYENADGTWGSYSTVETKTVNYGDNYTYNITATTTYKAASLNYSVTEAKTNQISVYRQTYALTVNKGSNITAVSGAGTYRAGQTITVSATKTNNVTCTSYASPTWTKNSGTGGSFNTTSGASVNFTMGTSATTITAASTASNVNQTITFKTSNATNITLNGNTKTDNQTLAIPCGTYNLTGTFPTGYEFSSWSATAGTLGSTTTLSTTYKVVGPATITLTGRTSYPVMQSYTKTTCEAQASNAPVTVVDNRDNITYEVRYINGNCWMVENLALGASAKNSAAVVARTLTSANSNVSSNYTTTTTSLTNGNSNDIAYVTCSATAEYGCYYNYAAATAGTITGSSNSTVASYDICPKGWALPTRAQVNTLGGGYDNYVTTYVSDFSPAAPGLYNGGSLSLAGSVGLYWSSTANSSTRRYVLRYNSRGLTSGEEDSSNYYLRNEGLSIRCVAK